MKDPQNLTDESLSQIHTGEDLKQFLTQGESYIDVPGDREASFNPMIVPKRQNIVDGVENMIVSLYAKGVTVSGIEQQLREVYNFEVSASTISRITDTVANDIVAWQNRPLEPVHPIVWRWMSPCL